MADTLESLEIEVKHSASGADAEINKVADAVTKLSNSLNGVPAKLKKLVEVMNAVKGNMNLTINDNSTTQTAEVINNVQQASARAGKATQAVGSGIRSMSREASKANKPLNVIVRSLARIAFYRAIRTILKNVGQAFSEGLQAAYAFSSGIDGAGHRFAEAMDNIKSSSNAMKGQLGSAFISLYAAVAPILIALIDIITRVADAISQLLAAFTGGTYLKANKTSAEWADNMQRGAGGAKEWKNQLLGFDEINRLNEPSGGGGGSGSNPLDGFDFEDTPIEDKFKKIADTIKSAIQWIEDHLDLVKSVAEAIGIAILAWKLGNFISNLLGLEAPMSKVLGIALAIGGAFVLVKGACDAWVNGVDWDNLTMMIGGTLAMTLGLGLAFGTVGASIGLLIGGVAMLVVGFKDWITTGELSTQTFYLLEGGIIAVGVALALLTHSWIPLVVAAVAAIALAIYNYWDEISAFFSRIWNTIKETFSSALDSIRFQFSKDWEAIKDKAVEIWDKLSTKAEEVWNAISDFFVGGFNTARDTIVGVLSELSQWFDSTFGKLVGWCKTAHDWLQDVLTGLGLVGASGGSDFNSDDGFSGRGGKFASGGFPDEGQLFIARENGAEMVGTMGGRTAVANNDQIVEGIRQGVYDAVLAANANNGGGGEFRLYLDSKQIKYGLERVDRAWGV